MLIGVLPCQMKSIEIMFILPPKIFDLPCFGVIYEVCFFGVDC